MARRLVPMLVIGFFSAAASCAQSALPPDLEALEWMAGCWVADVSAMQIEEQWMEPRAGNLLGMARTTDGGVVIGYEFMRVELESDTLVTFTAHPAGQTVTEFRGIISDREFVAENPAHDFPQRVGYRAVGVDSLVARIEGVQGGQPHRVEFAYARTRCPEGGR